MSNSFRMLSLPMSGAKGIIHLPSVCLAETVVSPHKAPIQQQQQQPPHQHQHPAPAPPRPKQTPIQHQHPRQHLQRPHQHLHQHAQTKRRSSTSTRGSNQQKHQLCKLNVVSRCWTLLFLLVRIASYSHCVLH